MRILHQFKAKVDGPLFRATGPSIHLGDGTFGAAKSWGLFPDSSFSPGQSRRPIRAISRRPIISGHPPSEQDHCAIHGRDRFAGEQTATDSVRFLLFARQPQRQGAGRNRFTAIAAVKTAQPLAHLGSRSKMGRPPFSANRTLCFTESARAGKQPSPRAFHSLDSHPCTRVSGRQFPTLSSRGWPIVFNSRRAFRHKRQSVASIRRMDHPPGRPAGAESTTPVVHR